MVLIRSRTDISNGQPCSTGADTAPGISELFCSDVLHFVWWDVHEIFTADKKGREKKWKIIVSVNVPCIGCFMNLLQVDHRYTVLILLSSSSLSIATSPASPTSPTSQGLPSKQIVHDFPAPLTPCLKSFPLTPPPLPRAWPMFRAQHENPPFSCCWYAKTTVFSQNSHKRRSCYVLHHDTYCPNACQTHTYLCTSWPIRWWESNVAQGTSSDFQLWCLSELFPSLSQWNPECIRSPNIVGRSHSSYRIGLTSTYDHRFIPIF